jgi:hypothetical protein
MGPCDAMIEEYKLLRAEVLQSTLHRLNVTAMGLATLVALIGGAVLAIVNGESHAAAIVLAFAGPTVSVVILHLWVAETNRARRASWFLWGLSRRLNKCPGTDGMRWEEDLRMRGSPRPPRSAVARRNMHLFRGHYYAVLILFGVVAVAAPFAALFLWPPPVLLAALVGIVILIAVGQPLRLVFFSVSGYDEADPDWPAPVEPPSPSSEASSNVWKN